MSMSMSTSTVFEVKSSVDTKSMLYYWYKQPSIFSSESQEEAKKRRQPCIAADRHAAHSYTTSFQASSGLPFPRIMPDNLGCVTDDFIIDTCQLHAATVALNTTIGLELDENWDICNTRRQTRRAS